MPAPWQPAVGFFGTIPLMRRRIGVLVCVLALPAVLLAPVWRLAGLGAIEDDVLYYLPMRSLLGELLRSGTLPYYNAWTGLGRPLLADPQTAVFYPPSWLFAVLDPLTAYAAVLWLHYSLAAWGAYRLLRSWHLRPAAALFGAMLFAGCGFMLAHRAHFAMVHAAAWTPIVFWRFERYATRGTLRRLAVAALAAAMQCFAGHVQVAAITLLGLGVYLSLRCVRRGEALLRLGLGWTLAAGLFAVQWLPTMAYTLECTRMHRGYMDFTENSYNPISLVGWVLPFFLGQRRPNFFDQPWWGPSHQVEQFCYIGIVPLVLAVACWRAGLGHDRRLRAAGGLALFGLLLALGLYGPICPLLYWLPGASLFRVPARALLLVHLAIVVLGSAAFDGLLRTPTPWRARLRYVLQNLTSRPVRSTLVITAVCVVPFLIALPLVPAGVREPLRQALSLTNPALWMPVIVIAASLAAMHMAAWAGCEVAVSDEGVEGTGIGEQGTQPPGRAGGMAEPLAPMRQRISLFGLRTPLLHRRPMPFQHPGLVLVALVTLLDLVVVGWSIDVPAEYGNAAELLNPPVRAEWLGYVQGAGTRAQGAGRGGSDAAMNGWGPVASVTKSQGHKVARSPAWPVARPAGHLVTLSPRDLVTFRRVRRAEGRGVRGEGQGTRHAAGLLGGQPPSAVAAGAAGEPPAHSASRGRLAPMVNQPGAPGPHVPTRMAGRRSLRASPCVPRGSRLWVVTSREHGVPGEYIDPLGRGVADTNILLGVPSLTDYGPLQPMRFVDRFAFEPWGEALRAWQQLEDAGWMPRFNVGWVLLCDPALPAPATGRLVTTTSSGYRLYRIDAPLGEAYVEPLTQRQAVRVEHVSPQRLRVRVDFGPMDAVGDEATKRRSDEGQGAGRRVQGTGRRAQGAGITPGDAETDEWAPAAQLSKSQGHKVARSRRWPVERPAGHLVTLSLCDLATHQRVHWDTEQQAGHEVGAAAPLRRSGSPQPAGSAARLVVARLAVRGWRATLDGRPVPLRVAYGCLLAVPLSDPGTHTIELWYQPPGLLTGLVVTCASVVIVAGCLCVRSEERSTRR